MKLLDIVNDSSFILSRNKREVIESLESVIYKITGQYLSKSKHEKSNCAIIYKLIQKYISSYIKRLFVGVCVRLSVRVCVCLCITFFLNCYKTANNGWILEFIFDHHGGGGST